MAIKIQGKDRRALLQGMNSLKGELLAGKNLQRRIIDRETLREQRLDSKSIKWKYNPTDLVRCRDWRYGTFIATIISVEDQIATLLGPMGTVIVACDQLQLVDRYDDPCDDGAA